MHILCTYASLHDLNKMQLMLKKEQLLCFPYYGEVDKTDPSEDAWLSYCFTGEK